MCFVCRAQRARAKLDKALADIRGPGAALLDMSAVADAISEARITLAEIEAAAQGGFLVAIDGSPEWLWKKEDGIDDLVRVTGQHEGTKTLQ